ncbi:MAG: S49 family peptidase [Acidobacteriota bacterium]
MKRVIVGLLAVIGGLALVAAGVVLVVGAGTMLGKGIVLSHTVLEVDFERPLVEHVADDPLARLIGARHLVLREVVEALERASSDARVVALVARVGAAPMGLAQVQELRDAVLTFRKSGKPAIAYAETFGEVGPGNGAYYLATAFDEIYLLPAGDIGLTGLIYESQFLRGTLEKVGITPRMDHRHEYKNAMNAFTERQYTEAHREAMQRLVDSQFSQMVRGIATGRRLGEASVRALVDRGPFLGQEAVDAGLVDALAYRDEVLERVSKRAGPVAHYLGLPKYLERTGSPWAQGATVALIYGLGGVTRGRSGYDPLFDAPTMGADTVAAAFRAAVADDDVRAILFRVDSPGGSYVASDAIWRETVRAKDAGKPVVVSMGDVAGSGGYFVAMAADRIVAQPATITGSIGVVGGKMLTAGMWEKLGLSWDDVRSSANATMWTGTHDYSPAEWARFQGWLDRVYADFTAKVAKGRRLSIEKVNEGARGRIWTGEDAKALGLVDELGGFPVALRLVREVAGLPAGAPIKLKPFPGRRTLLEALLQQEPESSEQTAEAAALLRAVRALQPLARLAVEAGLGPDPGVLSMPSEVLGARPR